MNILRYGLLLLALLRAPGALAIEIGVNNNDPACDSGPGAPFCTISGALDLAQPGDTISVARGSDYRETIEVNTSNIAIVGIGAPTLRTDGLSQRPVLTINATGVRFEGFEITGSPDGVSVLGNNNNVSSNRVHDNFFTGIVLGSSRGEEVHVSGNLVAYNTIAGGSSGIYVTGDQNTIVGNSATNNTQTGGIVVSGNNNVLRKNLAGGCAPASGFTILGRRNIVSRNRATSNAIGFDLSGDIGSSTGLGRKNRVTRNVAIGNKVIGFNDALDGKRRNIYRRNTCKRNGHFGSVPAGICKPQRGIGGPRERVAPMVQPN